MNIAAHCPRTVAAAAPAIPMEGTPNAFFSAFL